MKWAVKKGTGGGTRKVKKNSNMLPMGGSSNTSVEGIGLWMNDCKGIKCYNQPTSFQDSKNPSKSILVPDIYNLGLNKSPERLKAQVYNGETSPSLQKKALRPFKMKEPDNFNVINPNHNSFFQSIKH